MGRGTFRGRKLPRGVTVVQHRSKVSFKARWQNYQGKTVSRCFDDLDAAAEFVQHARVESQRIRAGLMAPPRPPAPTLDELVASVMRRPPATWSPKHRRDVEVRLTRHVLPELGERRVDAICSADVEMVRDGVVRRGLAPATANKVVAALSAVLRVGKVKPNPAREQGLRLKVQVEPPRVLDDDEALALIEHAGRPWRGLFAAAVYTGARLSELTGSRWGDIDLERRWWVIRRSVGERTKNSKVRRVRIVPELVPYLTDIHEGLYGGRPPPAGYLVFRRAHRRRSDQWDPLASPTKGRIVSPDKALARAATAAGVWPVPGFHALRHTHASALVDRGVPLTAVRDQLGHSSLEVTNRYAHSRGLDAVDALALRRSQATVDKSAIFAAIEAGDWERAGALVSAAAQRVTDDE